MKISGLSADKNFRFMKISVALFGIDMTIGKKLMAGSVSFLALSVLLSVSSLYTTESLGNELSQTASVSAGSVELAGATATEAANMLSVERGLLLRLALGDQTKAAALHDDFAKATQSLDRNMAQLRSSHHVRSGTGRELGHQRGARRMAPSRQRNVAILQQAGLSKRVQNLR